LGTIKYEKAEPKEIEKFELRQAARAVVFDNEGKIALLFVSKKNYHKLPGGGVGKGESIKDALQRECLEEIGCNIKATGEIGRIIEYRTEWKTKQESFCYIAEVVGEKGQPSFVEEEIEAGFVGIWVNLDEAIKILEKDAPRNRDGKNYDGKLIRKRDLIFLKEVKKLIK
jgi:8-oxo-dGTP pyrophosphatase MutT (NUDIX family)